MDLKSALIQTPPREVGGSRGSSGFEYQKHWGLCHLLDLHKTKNQYAVLFDYHDDILELDCPLNPKEARFYQVKSCGRTHWTMSALLSRKKADGGERGPSILGKMCHNYCRFKEFTKDLRLISNARFKVALRPGKEEGPHDRVSVAGLEGKQLAHLKEKLSSEPGLKELGPVEQVMTFERVDLSSENPSTHTKGILTEFLEQWRAGAEGNASAIYRALLDEISRLTARTVTPGDLTELIRMKGISREQFEMHLKRIAEFPQRKEALEASIRQLQAEQEDYVFIRNLSIAFERYELQKMDFADTTSAQLENIVRRGLANLDDRSAYTSLREKLELVCEECRVDLAQLGVPVNDTELMAIATAIEFG